jgi:anti-sigma factor RsiW
VARLTPNPDARGELFSAYLDGELSPDEVALVVAAIDGDEAAVEEFRALQAVRRTVRMLPSLEVPDALLPDGHLGALLSAYLDGELTVFEHKRVTGHLVACTECRSELHELDRARIAVRSLPGAEPTTQTEVAAVPRDRRWRRVVAGGLAAAAAVTLFVVLAGGGGEQPVLVLEDLANRHAARASAEPGFAVQPTGLEVSSP